MPRLRMKDRLIAAIRNHEMVEITYKGLTYHVEPYMIFSSRTGRNYLFAYKISGGFLKIPGPHLGDFILREITSVKKIGWYKPIPARLHKHSPLGRFHKVIYCSCFKEKKS